MRQTVAKGGKMRPGECVRSDKESQVARITLTNYKWNALCLSAHAEKIYIYIYTCINKWKGNTVDTLFLSPYNGCQRYM